MYSMNGVSTEWSEKCYFGRFFADKVIDEVI